MSERIQSLLEESATQDAESSAFTTWCHRVLADFPVTPYDTLRSFKTERFDYPEGRGRDFRLYPHKPAAEEFSSLAHHAWRAVGGDQDPTRGLCCAALASIEYVRAQLHSVFWIGSRLNIYRTHRPDAARQFVDSVLAIDWHDGEAVLRSNFQVFSCLGVLDSSADNLYNWSATIGRPPVCAKGLAPRFLDIAVEATLPEEIMSGAALLAVDAALSAADWQASIGLMSFAANAMWQAGFQSGWEGRDHVLREDAKHAGKRGGEQRHQASRELKLWALTQAISLRGSDMEIARKLVLQIPPQLQDASADPERLIYDALRSARKDARQGR